MKRNIDMTEGTPWKQMVAFAIPMIFTGLIDMFYSMADTAIVGRFVGVDALAAISCTGSLSGLIFNFAFGLIGGLVVITSQRYGAKDELGVRDSIGTSIIICVAFSVILTVLGCIFAMPLLNLINVPLNIIEDSYRYIITIYIGSTATVISCLFTSILRAIGDSKTPLLILILSSILNIVLNIVFVCWLKTGVLGAGIATVISKVVSCVVCGIYATRKFPLLRLSKENFRIKPRYLMAHIKLGTPMGLQSSIYTIGCMITNSYINPLGATILASISTAGYVRLLPNQIINSVSRASSTFTAQNKGAAKYDRIRTGIKTATYIVLSGTVIGSVFSILTSDLFVNLIVGTGEPEVKKYTLEYTIMMCPVTLATGLIYIYRGALISMGQSFLPFIYGFLELAAQVSTAAIFIPKIGFVGAALSQNAALFTTAILSFVTYIIYMRKHYGTAFKTQKESA